MLRSQEELGGPNRNPVRAELGGAYRGAGFSEVFEDEMELIEEPGPEPVMMEEAPRPFRPERPSSFAEAGLSTMQVEGLILKSLLSAGVATGRTIASELGLTFGAFPDEFRRLQGLKLIVYTNVAPMGDYEYVLTDAGRAALQAWLSSDTELVDELRDESMLKLFFSDGGSPQLRIDNIRVTRELHERRLAQLRALEPHASSGPQGPYLTLQLGIRVQECVIDWCRTTEQALKEK